MVMDGAPRSVSGSSRSARIAVQAAVVVGGVAALSWEVIWQLEASLALGVSALGTAITLAATMAGMTVGSLTAGRLLQKRESRASIRQPMRLYGSLELAIGISGLLLLPGFAFLETIDTRLFAVSPTLAPFLHVLGIALLLGPPTFAMGATIPTFKLVARSHGVPVSVLYGLNTAGASVGVLLFSFVLVPELGVANTCSLIAALNFLVFASGFAIRAATASTGTSSFQVSAEDHRPRPTAAVAGIVVFGTGLCTFALEVAWFRSLRAAFHSTTDSFAIMLASVLIPLALGARLVPWLRRRGLSPAALLMCAGVAILLATPLVERMDLFAWTEGRYWALVARRLALSLAILGPAMLFMGMALPWFLEEFPGPKHAGRLYGINTIGAVVGSLGAAWVLLPTLGFARSGWLCGVCVIGLALLAGAGRLRWGIAVVGAASLAVAVTQTSSLGRDRVQGNVQERGARILAFEEGPDATAAVVETRSGIRFLLIDGFVAAAQMVGAEYMQWMGRLPMFLHPDPESALVICMGTGQTANALREEGPALLDLVEINPDVMDMASLFPSNRGVLEDPRVHPIVMDGRAWLRRTQRRYDVITLEPMPPYFAGMNALYSKDFYEIMAQKLEPGGVVAQWLPIHLLSPKESASVAATFRAVFPDAVLWLDPVGLSGILLGRLDSGSSPLGREWPGLARRPTVRALTDEQIRQSLALDPSGLARYARIGSVITDDNQILAYRSQRRSFVTGDILADRAITINIISNHTRRPLLKLHPRAQQPAPRPR
jgi:spermidine synthase